MAVAVVTRRSPSRSLREIGPYDGIVRERQQTSRGGGRVSLYGAQAFGL
jgi:hypothetical protein